MAPMSLMTYEEARPWARAIKTRTTGREMPPCHIDKTIGITKFKNDPSLSDDEIRPSPSGSTPARRVATRPTCRRRGSSPTLARGDFKPDIVVKFPAYKVPAAGPDLFGNIYADIPIKTRTATSRRSRPAPATPASRKVVHHALTYAVDGSGQRGSLGDDSAGVDGGDFLVEYASGKNAEVYTGRFGRAAAGRQEGHGQLPPALDR